MKYQQYLISEQATLIEAMRKLDETAQKVLFVARGDCLVAALTDGDIRRYIMHMGELSAPVSEFANYTPKYICADEDIDAEAVMKRLHVLAMPIVDADMRILSIAFLNAMPSVQPQRQLHVPVVINAGGKGTRLYPYTKILPKPLIPVGEIPISEHIINRFWDMGCDTFYMIVNQKKNMIKAYYSELDKPYSVTFADEDKMLGTGGGLRLLRDQLKETFLFVNCDTIIDMDFSGIVKDHKKSGNAVTMICATKSFVFPYGVVDVGENGTIQSLREKPQMTYLTNTGCYIVEPKVIGQIEEDESVGFPSIVERCRDRGMRVGIYPISEHDWLDMGQFDTMEEMRKRLGTD